MAQAGADGTADDIGLAVMGVRGLHDLGNIIENADETEEEHVSVRRETPALHLVLSLVLRRDLPEFLWVRASCYASFSGWCLRGRPSGM